MLLEMTLAVKINLGRIGGGRFALGSGQSMKGEKSERVNPGEGVVGGALGKQHSLEIIQDGLVLGDVLADVGQSLQVIQDGNVHPHV